MPTDNSISFFRTDVFKNKYVRYAAAICLLLTIGAYVFPPAAKVLSLYKSTNFDFAIMLGFSFLSMLIIRTLKRIKIIF